MLVRVESPACQPPLARNTDPSTSHAAADAAHGLSAAHERLILGALREHGPMGKDAIAQRIGLHGHQVCKRMSALARAQLVKPTGRTVPSLAGRLETEWEVA